VIEDEGDDGMGDDDDDQPSVSGSWYNLNRVMTRSPKKGERVAKRKKVAGATSSRSARTNDCCCRLSLKCSILTAGSAGPSSPLSTGASSSAATSPSAAPFSRKAICLWPSRQPGHAKYHCLGRQDCPACLGCSGFCRLSSASPASRTSQMQSSAHAQCQG